MTKTESKSIEVNKGIDNMGNFIIASTRRSGSHYLADMLASVLELEIGIGELRVKDPTNIPAIVMWDQLNSSNMPMSPAEFFEYNNITHIIFNTRLNKLRQAVSYYRLQAFAHKKINAWVLNGELEKKLEYEAHRIEEARYCLLKNEMGWIDFLENIDIPYHTNVYEDLCKSTHTELSSILKFLGREKEFEVPIIEREKVSTDTTNNIYKNHFERFIKDSKIRPRTIVTDYFKSTESDKMGSHFYSNFYDMLFSYLTLQTNEPLRVLEVGVTMLECGSPFGFREMEQIGYYLGIDNAAMKTDYTTDKAHFLKVNAYRQEGLDAIAEHAPFDLLIDDGTHHLAHQKFFWENYQQFMNEKHSAIVVEDVPDTEIATRVEAINDVHLQVVTCNPNHERPNRRDHSNIFFKIHDHRR